MACAYSVFRIFRIKKCYGLGAVAHAYNLSTMGGQGGQISCGQEFETSLANTAKSRPYKKFKK